MMEKTKVGVLFGGRSGEHEVSLQSARSILANLDPVRFEVVQIAISHHGDWFAGANALDALEAGDLSQLQRVTLLAEPGHNRLYIRRNGTLEPYTSLDVLFPALHGTFGEDGTIQGLFEMAGFAYVGAGVLASALGMDKGVFKSVMKAYNLPVLPSVVVTRQQTETEIDRVIAMAESLADYPLFTKPANLGSSVGITKCRTRSDLGEGLMEAARYDRRIVIEKGLSNVREIEVSVLGNDQPLASVPGEVIPGEDFYSYTAKYLSDSSQLVIPAPLPEQVTVEIQRIAVAAYRAIDCAGMARVDFLVNADDLSIYLSEVNTLPGFTRISMYPKLWEASGLPYPRLIEQLIELALERKADREHTEFEYRRNA
ncbi:MAG: D-alanine--D-alanine ligase family protein [Bellilinea sp.]